MCNSVNHPQIDGFSPKASTHIIPPEHFSSWENPTPRQKTLMLKHQAIIDKFQRLWVLSHETEEDTKAMTIWEKCKGSPTAINCWPDSGTWPFTMGTRRAILFCQILQENFLFFLSYSFPSTCYRQIHMDFNLRFYSLKTRWLGWDMRLVFLFLSFSILARVVNLRPS